MTFDHLALDPRAKLVFALVVSLVAVVIPRLDALAGLGVVLVAVVLFGHGLSVRTWLGLLAPFKVLVPIILVLNTFFYADGSVLWAVDGVPFRLTVGGLEASLVIASRLLVIAAVAVWFSATTDAEAFEVALVRLGVPQGFAFLLSLTVRLVPEIEARYRAVDEAQRARGLRVEGGPIARARARLPVLVPFFVSIVRFGYELGDALEVRGFGKVEHRTYQLALSFGRTDALFTGFGIVVLVGFLGWFGALS